MEKKLIVLEVDDVQKFLQPGQQRALDDMLNTIQAGREVLKMKPTPVVMHIDVPDMSGTVDPVADAKPVVQEFESSQSLPTLTEVIESEQLDSERT
jgi:hypothetical protein